MSIFDRLGVDLGSVLGVIFGHFGALIGQSWSQDRLRIVLTSKKCFFKKTSATEGESTILRSKSAQDGTQDDPRSPQDGSKIVLDRFFCLLIFRFDFGSFLVPFWCRFGLPNGPQGVTANWGLEGPWGSKTVLKSSWFGSLVVLSFGIAFLVVLGSFWGRFWALRGSFWCFFGISTHRFNPSTHQFVDSTHQLINPPIQLIKPSSHRFNPSTHRFNSSTHQPMALRHFLTRPGGLRAARLNKIPHPQN